jgi:hypothetical protein
VSRGEPRASRLFALVGGIAAVDGPLTRTRAAALPSIPRVSRQLFHAATVVVLGFCAGRIGWTRCVGLDVDLVGRGGRHRIGLSCAR